MKSFRWVAVLIATTIGGSCIPTGHAEDPIAPMSAPTVSNTSVGQDQTVNYNNKFAGIGFGKTISKTIAIEPGSSQVSLDGLGLRDRVNLTLVNPSATPLQFETTQRWGKQVVAVIPAHSQQVVSFSKSRPFTHEVKFFVMQQPSNAISTNEDYVTQQTAAVASDQQTAIKNQLDQQSAMMHQALDQQTAQIQNSQKEAMQEAARQRQTEGRSAVRGYW